jgi:hypothetical protein
MSWNIQKPGDFINGPLTVVGIAQFNSNVGIATTPSGWGGTGFLNLPSNTAVSFKGTQGSVVSNAYYDTQWRYYGNGLATQYFQNNGAHTWFIAPNNTSGAAAPLTFVQAMSLNANGALSLQGGNSVANGVGITFPAAQSASTDANTLDDYEEGSWTPTIVGNTTAGTGTYTFQGGRYTKIGNRVFVEAYISWSAHTGTGDMKIGGLPFSITSLAFYTSGCIGDVNAISITAGNTLAIVGINTSSEILFKQLPVGGGSSANVPIDTQANISFSFCYMV